MGARPALVQRAVTPVAPQAKSQPAIARRVRPQPARSAIDGMLSRKVSTLLPLRTQAQMQVSSAGDPAEREADATARHVMAIALPVARPVSSPFHVDRFAVQRKAAGPATADDDVAADIRASLGGGAALAPSVRRFMEPRFNADFSAVRVHTDSRAAGLAARLSARAFAFGKDIVFARGQYQPDTPEGKELLAHELTHTIQQRAVVQRQEAAPAITHNAASLIQRFGLDTVRDYIADKANIIPGFRLFTIVIGVNPINMAKVDPTPANILRAAIEFIPGGGLVTQALDNSGVFEKVANWAAQQIRTLVSLGGALIQALKEFLKSLGVADFARPGATWDRAKALFSGPIDRVKSTVAGWLVDIVQMIKDAILKPLGKLAEGTPAYPLLKALLGKDPVTGEDAPFDGDAVVGGLMKLAGQEEIWSNVKKANAVPRVVAWFQSAKAKLVGFVKQIPSLAIAAFKSLELIDIILIPKAFIKIGRVFGGFVVDFVSWALDAGWKLLEIVFDVVSPGAWGYIQKTGAALKSILKDPLPFVGNLVKAAKLGFTNFADRFLTHLKAGLLDWLVGSLPGVYIPKALSLPEFGKLALSVFGISWAQIRAKIVKALGPAGETIMKSLETAFDVVKALVTGGPAAAWEVIKDKLSALKDTIIDGVIGFIKDTVVQKAIPKLIAMFIPGAGFISAIVSIYDTVMVFVEKISKIIAVVTAFINSIVAIASGNIGAAAAKVESILAGLLSLAISFLAGFVGLGKVADKIRGVIEKVRDKVDKALDAAIGFIINKAKSLFASLFGKKGDDKRTDMEKVRDLKSAVQAGEALLRDSKLSSKQIVNKLNNIKKQYKLTALTLVKKSDSKTSEVDYIHAEINPDEKSQDVTRPKAVADQVAPATVGMELQVNYNNRWLSARIEEFDDAKQLVWCKVEGGGRRGITVSEFVSSYLGGANTSARTPPPIEPYNREKHYGKTPTAADRTFKKAGPNDVVDHDPPLVKRYYDGDPMYGGKPGKDLTQAERLASAKNRNMMKLQPADESNQQGGEMSGFSKKKRKELGL